MILKLQGSSVSVEYQLHQVKGSVTLCICGVREREEGKGGGGAQGLAGIRFGQQGLEGVQMPFPKKEKNSVTESVTILGK